MCLNYNSTCPVTYNEDSCGLNPLCCLSAAARKKKQTKPLSFKVGMGKVIRGVSDANVFLLCASKLFSSSTRHFSPRRSSSSLILLLSQWDEALLTMSKGETARLEIEPEWAYGKKGLPDSKYPSLLVCASFRARHVNMYVCIVVGFSCLHR